MEVASEWSRLGLPRNLPWRRVSALSHLVITTFFHITYVLSTFLSLHFKVFCRLLFAFGLFTTWTIFSVEGWDGFMKYVNKILKSTPTRIFHALGQETLSYRCFDWNGDKKWMIYMRVYIVWLLHLDSSLEHRAFCKCDVAFKSTAMWKWHARKLMRKWTVSCSWCCSDNFYHALS